MSRPSATIIRDYYDLLLSQLNIASGQGRSLPKADLAYLKAQRTLQNHSRHANCTMLYCTIITIHEDISIYLKFHYSLKLLQRNCKYHVREN